MAPLPRITVLSLLNLWAQYEPAIRKDRTNSGFMVGAEVVRYFLGREWIEEHVYPHPTKGGLFRLHDPIIAETQLNSFRVTNLGELLINLQNIEGFDDLIRRMKNGEPEPFVAELSIGRILYVNDVNFRFVTPVQATGKDYDLEITYPDGTVVCADTKCKIETTEPTASTINDSLMKARKQTPKDKPCMVFVMVPQHWLETEDNRRLTIETAYAFFKGNPAKNIPPAARMVSVVFYSEPLTYFNGILAQAHRQKEISNPDNKFFPGRNWDLLLYKPSSDKMAVGWDALPEKWIRLVNFPHELGKHGQIKPTAHA